MIDSLLVVFYNKKDIHMVMCYCGKVTRKEKKERNPSLLIR